MPALDQALIFGRDATGGATAVGVSPGAQATSTLTSNNTNVANGVVVTIGTIAFTFRVFRASNTLTGDGTVVSNGDTVTIGSKVYTFQDTLTNVDGHVKIAGGGSAAADTLTNLFNAINGTGGTIGTDYATATTANTQVVATNPSGTTVLLTAILAGTDQNAIVTTESSSHLSFASATTLGGSGATYISTGGTAEGEVNIGASADASLLNLINAINLTGTGGVDYFTRRTSGHPQVTAAAAVTSHTFAITAVDAGAAGNTIATTETSATLSFTAATMTGGLNGSLIAAPSNKFLNIATGTTTLVKTGPGVLHSLTINKSVASTITIYDALTAVNPVIATIAASVVEGTLVYDIAFSTGLTIVTAGASDLTVSYR